MLNPYEWDEYLLLITVEYNGRSTTFLLNQVSQETFVEFTRAWGGQLSILNVMRLTEDTFELLHDRHPADRILGE